MKSSAKNINLTSVDDLFSTEESRTDANVSDTGGRENSRRLYLWEMNDYHRQPLLEMLGDKFGAQEENLSDAFYNIANALAKEYYDNHKQDISYLTQNSFLEEYDEDNIRVALW